jgi:hypothetical protein
MLHSRHGVGAAYDHATLWVHAVKEFDMPTRSRKVAA